MFILDFENMKMQIPWTQISNIEKIDLLILLLSNYGVFNISSFNYDYASLDILLWLRVFVHLMCYDYSGSDIIIENLF